MRAPAGTRCGDVYRINDRRPQIVATRKLAGPIGITTERADSHVCEGSAKWALELGGDQELAVCERHRRELQ